MEAERVSDRNAIANEYQLTKGRQYEKEKAKKSISQSINEINIMIQEREREKERKKEREIEGKKRKEIQFQIVMETAYKYVAYTFDPAKSTSKSTVTSIASSLSFFLLFFSLSLLSSFLSCLYLFHCIFALLSSSFFFLFLAPRRDGMCEAVSEPFPGWKRRKCDSFKSYDTQKDDNDEDDDDEEKSQRGEQKRSKGMKRERKKNDAIVRQLRP